MENLFRKINRHSLSSFRQYLAMRGASHRSIKRKESSLKKFFSWAVEKGYIRENPFKPKFSIFHFPFSIRSYRALPYFTYLNFLILVVFFAALGFGIYQQLILKAPEKLAYPAAETRPKRHLSFQGRLTDSTNTPITTAVNFQFKLYDHLTLSTNLLWDSNTCSIDPDEDGIFNTILGLDCGTEIASSVFSENASVWLEITVGTSPNDETLSPRIQIATVAYALNAETLQGFPLAFTTNSEPTATMGAIARTVPALNPAGNLVIASASPKIWSTSGTFQIRGQALSIVTENAGNITIAPDTSGVLNLTFSSLGTGNAINAEAAQLGTSGGREANTLYYGKVANNNTNLNLLKLSSGSSPTPKFTVDTSGNASAAGYLRANTTGSYFTGDITVSGGDITGVGSVGLDIGETSSNYITSSVGFAVGGTTTYYINSSGTGNLNALTLAGNLTLNANVASNLIPSATSTYDLGSSALYWNNLYVNNIYGGGSGTSGFWSQQSGALYPTNSTVDLLIGGTATSSAKFAFTNVLTGTPVASFSGNLVLASTADTSRTIGATNMNPLTLGTATTGDLQFYSSLNKLTSAGALTLASTITANTTDTINGLSINAASLTDAVNITMTGYIDMTTTQWIGLSNTEGRLVFTDATPDEVDVQTANLDLNNNLILNIGDAGTDFTTGGGLTLTGYATSSSSLAVGYSSVLAGVGNAAFAGNVGIGTTSPSSALSVGTSSQFQVNTSGDIIKLKNLTYSWPSSQVSGGFLRDTNGSGTLEWTTTVPATSVSFTNITSGTNTQAAMVVGAGASLNYTSTGTINASSLVGATWIAPGTIGSTTPSTGAFTTLTSSGNSTIGTGASSINTIGSTTTPGTLTLHGATTLDNTFTVSGSYLTSLGGNLTVTGTAWTATPTISGLITATSGLTANGALTANSNFTLGDNGDTGSINTSDWDIGTTGDMTGIGAITMDGNFSQTGATTFSTGTGLVSINGNLATSLIPNSTSYNLGSSSNYWGAVYANNYYAPGTGVSGYWQRNLGTLSPTNITDDTLVGGTATSSALVRLPGITNQNAWFNLGTGNVGIGDVSPLSLLTVGSGDKFQVGTSGNLTINTGTSATVITAERSNNGLVIQTRVGGTPGVDIGTEGAVGHSTIVFKNIDILMGKNNSGGLAFGSGVSYLDVPAGATDINIKGNVGIGSTSPEAKLTINGTNTGKALTIFNETGTNDIFTASASGSPKFVITNAGSVGIGTTSPGSPLQITKSYTNAASTELYVNPTYTYSTNGSYFDVGSSNYISLAGAANNTSAVIGSQAYIDNSNTGTISSIYGGRFVIDNESTGTINAARGVIAEIYGGSGSINNAYGFYSLVQLSGISTGYGLYIDNIQATNDWGIYQSDSSDDNYFAGNVGIGTTAPGKLLEISGTANASIRLTDSDGITASAYLEFYDSTTRLGSIGLIGTSDENLYITSESSKHIVVQPAGNVGIGTNNPATFKLEVAGNIGPEATGTRDLGSTARVWNNVYANNYYQGSTALGLWLDAGTYIYPVNVTTFQVTDTGNLTVPGTASFNSAGVTIDASNFVNAAKFVDTAGSGAYFLDPAGAASLNVAGYATTAASLAVGYSSLPSGPGNAVFSGNVGIGTTNPTSGMKLDVRGSVVSSGSFYPGNGAIQTSRSFGDDGTSLTASNLKMAGTLNMNGQLITGSAAIRVNSDEWAIQNTTGNVKFRFKTSDGSLWIGGATADGTASQPLHVVGNGYFSGNVGIGTTGPTSKLHLAVSDAPADPSVGGLYLYNSGATTTSDAIIAARVSGATGGNPFYSLDIYGVVGWSMGIDNADSDKFKIMKDWNFTSNPYLTIDTSGNVGIGTTGPTGKLHITHDTTETGSDSYALKIKASDASVLLLGANSKGGFISAMQDYLSWTNRPLLLQSQGGNVGIGTTGPNAKLSLTTTGAELSGTAASAALRTMAGALGTTAGNTLKLASIGFTSVNQSSLGIEALRTANGTDWTTTAIGLKMDVDNTSPVNNAQIWLTSGGNVGIGTTGPLSKLSVGGVGVANVGVYGNSISNSTAGVYGQNSGISGYGVYGSGTGTSGIGVYGSGSGTGVQGTGPAAGYGVYGYNANSNGYGVYCYSGNTGGCAGNTAWTPASDARLKKDIVTIPNALYKVMHLRGVDFNWIAGGQADMGLIAQEVLPYVPEVVSQDANTGMYGVRTSQLTGLLVEAIKEQQGQIASLSAQVSNLTLTDTGDIILNGNPVDGYTVSTPTGITDRIGAFAKVAVAQLKAGFIQTQELFAEKKIVSPLVETQQLTATSIQATESKFGKLLVQNEQGETVASIDSEGNVYTEGDITARSATFSGTLYADEIITKKVYTEGISARSGTFGELLAATVSASQIAAADLTEIQTRLATLETQLTGTNPVTPEASESALLAEVQNWEITNPSQDLKITSNLKVLGRTSLADTSIAGQLMVDASIAISESGINSLTGPLYLNSLGLGPVDILAGKVVIDIDGNVQIAGGISASKLVLNAKESEFGKILEIKNPLGETVASIDASGSASFASLAIAADYSATQSATLAEIRTNATSGLGILPAGETEFTIFNPKVSENTLVYITPVSSTENKVLYVVAKKAGEWFKVGIDMPITNEIKFNWWIIN